MNNTEKVFGFINGIFLFIILLITLFIFLNPAVIAGFLGTTIGILFGLLIFILPLIVGIIFSIKHLLKKTEGLSLFEKILVAFPLINLLLIISSITLSQL